MSDVLVRPATPADLPALGDAWRAFEREVPPPAHQPVDEAEELREIEEIVHAGGGVVAERDGRLVGFALARPEGRAVLRLSDLWVDPERRRDGIAAALARRVAEHAVATGHAVVDLEVMASNTTARAVYQRWGFVEERMVLSAPASQLVDRLRPSVHAVSFASIHVQTDDAGWVERTAAQFAPRIGSPGSRVEGPRNGWTTLYDPVVDADPTALLRYAREVSDRMGAVVVALSYELDKVVRLIALDRGGIVDEYLSVPEFYGPLPPGDVIGLAANATVLHRLTGADPAAVKAVARTAVSPDELPPAHELLAAIAGVLGLEGALHGFEPR
jgi:ribosomal protein S18 acetylase RimI-like enzyme